MDPLAIANQLLRDRIYELEDELGRVRSIEKTNRILSDPCKSSGIKAKFTPLNPDSLVDSIIVETNGQSKHQRIVADDESSSKSKHHITWDEYFMSVAQLAARRSKDPSTKVGACIVNEQNKIVATGYNGMPNGVHDSQVPWTKEGSYLETKYAYVVHAELNAILNSISTDLKGCRVYVSLFPCNECAKAIIQSGIRHVIYLSDKHADKDTTRAAKIMFEMAGVTLDQYWNLFKDPL